MLFSKLDRAQNSSWWISLKEKTLNKPKHQLFACFLFQFRYKRRVYTQTHLDEKQLSKLHTKVRAHTFHADVLLWNNMCSILKSSYPKRVSACRFDELSLVIPDDTNQIYQFQITSPHLFCLQGTKMMTWKHTLYMDSLQKYLLSSLLGFWDYLLCYSQDGNYAIGNRLDAWGWVED